MQKVCLVPVEMTGWTCHVSQRPMAPVAKDYNESKTFGVGTCVFLRLVKGKAKVSFFKGYEAPFFQLYNNDLPLLFYG